MLSQYTTPVEKEVNTHVRENELIGLHTDGFLGWNSCSSNNCSQLCLTEMSNRSCSCAYGVLDGDGVMCNSKET